VRAEHRHAGTGPEVERDRKVVDLDPHVAEGACGGAHRIRRREHGAPRHPAHTQRHLERVAVRRPPDPQLRATCGVDCRGQRAGDLAVVGGVTIALPTDVDRQRCECSAVTADRPAHGPPVRDAIDTPRRPCGEGAEGGEQGDHRLARDHGDDERTDDGKKLSKE
jgi:hypothetical protein